MRALVTGGAGFIGSNVVDLLIKNKWNVTVVDNLSTGYADNVNPLAEFHEMDLLDSDFQKKMLLDFAKFDVVFHLAALPRVEPSIQDPVTSNEKNVTATLNLFESCRLANIKNIVFSSSSSVYGDAKEVPTNELEPTNPMSPYALQKLIGDQYAELFCKLYNMNITCLRYFNVYGNREPTVGAYVPVVGIWFRQLASDKALTITGDGKQSRDFVNVLDVARANLMCAESNLKGFNVFNVGYGKDLVLNDIAPLISDNITYIAPRFEPKRTCADTTKIKKAVGWEPTISLEEYIRSKVSRKT